MIGIGWFLNHDYTLQSVSLKNFCMTKLLFFVLCRQKGCGRKVESNLGFRFNQV